MRRFGGIGVAWFVATVVAVTIAAAAVGSVRSEVTDVPIVLGVSVSPSITTMASEVSSDSPDDGPDLEPISELTLAPFVESLTPDSPTIETSTTVGPPVTDQAETPEDHTHQVEGTKSLPQAGSTSSAPTTQAATTSTTLPTTNTTAAGTVTTTPPPPTTAPPTTAPPTTAPPPTSAPTTTTTTAPAPETYARMIDTDGGALSVSVYGDTVVFRRAFPKSGWRFDLASVGPEVVEARFTNIDDRSLRIKVRITADDGTLDISITPSY